MPSLASLPTWGMLALASLTPSSLAQCLADWNQAASTGPSIRAYSAMVFDTAADRVLLYGGGYRNTFYGDLYSWSGSAWTLIAPGGAGTPGNREAVACAYDTARDRMVVFGGAGITTPDTWEWDGTSWTQAALTGPTPRGFVACAYDAARGVTVMFGGWASGFSYFADTWTWNGSAWTEQLPAGPLPEGRGFAAAAYDPVRERVVLFGGLRNSMSGSTYFGDTWEWDGTTWSQITPATSPDARAYHAMDYDPSVGRVVLYGGFDISSGNFNDTWTWDGANWQRLDYGLSAPLGRQAAPMVYDEVRAQHVLFGGVRSGSVFRNDTWVGVMHTRCCPADLTGSSDPNDPTYGVPDGDADADDFFYYLDQFVAMNFAVADLTTSSDPNDPSYGVPDGMIDAADFFFYLDLFVGGCP